MKKRQRLKNEKKQRLNAFNGVKFRRVEIPLFEPQEKYEVHFWDNLTEEQIQERKRRLFGFFIGNGLEWKI